MNNLRLLATRFLILVLISLNIIGYVLSQNVETEDKLSRSSHLADRIYYNRYHSNNAKYLVWLLVLVPVFICIPCLIWVWCSDHCLQILKYRSNMKVLKEKKLMNEIILTNLSDSIFNKELPGGNSSLPHPPPPLPHQIPIPQPQPNFPPQMGVITSPPPVPVPPTPTPFPQLTPQPVLLEGSQYSSVIPTHVQLSPSYIPNLNISGPVNLGLSHHTQQEHVHHHCGSGAY
ncbi:uncharacterized protein cubi_00319 [Cryptosporidium ubiquitum]|uniref:Transmembrane protein n=1 Tax=Cryptosporidium ubiquitum TaxID=857276 RepID=A0A1J4MKP1_9CRYT|nr:uncharacterized protein cubi_00319 [Cryptosporidium ubiquitum]OII74766.1 hypothetical protein cubi_00319 [Cryptosporidium ubiquitum]